MHGLSRGTVEPTSTDIDFNTPGSNIVALEAVDLNLTAHDLLHDGPRRADLRRLLRVLPSSSGRPGSFHHRHSSSRFSP